METEDLFIRNCKLTDIRAIQQIEDASFDDPYSSMVFRALYLSSSRIFRIACVQEKIVGYSVAKPEIRDGDTIVHLISLAVDPQSRGKGVGSKLVEDVILQTKDAYPKCKRMELEVRMDNKLAVGLYIKFGFRQTQTISNYYGREKDALNMVLDYKSEG